MCMGNCVREGSYTKESRWKICKRNIQKKDVTHPFFVVSNML